MTCHCSQCSENPKPTYSEEYRHECEVRHVAKQKVPWIREHLGKVKEKRGEAEYHRLRNAVMIERERLNQQHAEINAGWSMTWFNNMKSFRSDDLRQIADNLDELNGVSVSK